jgi:KDO2-lipid IV(A) lauroyltransferase
VALPHKDKKVNSFFDGQRKRLGIDVIPTGVAVKRCYKTLKGGGMCAFLGDRDFSNTGLKVSLCGRTAEIPRGPGYFACKTGALIVPVFFIRRDKYYFDFIMDKTIVYGCDGINSEDDLVKAYAQVIGKYIKQYPDQWYMFQNYWVN